MRPMKWVTRERPRIDRVACAWLIRRFIDPEPTFLFVPSDQVAAVAERAGAHAYHVRGVGPFAPSAQETGFDVIARHHGLLDKDPALERLATIIRGADKGFPEAPAESAGLRAIMVSFADVYADDDEVLRMATPAYEALYAWCRRQTGARAQSAGGAA